MAELKKLQQSLQNDDEEKKHFTEAENYSESDSDSDPENREEIIKVLPVKKTSHKIDAILVEHLIQQQKAYLKAHKTIYKLRHEIDHEEIKSRYLKLDLNNAQVKIDELSEYQKKYTQAYSVNVIFLILFISYLVKYFSLFF